jgi:spore maturation protein CgeB
MRVLFYTHSIVSDWNHGNAHFLRGIMRELVRRGHQPLAVEPEDSWSFRHLLMEGGPEAVKRFKQAFPEIRSIRYGPRFDHEALLAGADLVIVHEWTDPALVARIGAARRSWGTFTLLFHDTHHRSVSAEEEISRLMLEDYDAILAFGEALRERYLRMGWGAHVHTWHEAADISLFRRLPKPRARNDIIWIGNWGDDERSTEIAEFLIEPVARLGLKATVHGVRYPAEAIESLKHAGIAFRGWIANADVPMAFARHRLTVHIPRRPYRLHLPGIPTIRMFEALACGIPLISAPWDDIEHLFTPGEDFLFARDGAHMKKLIGILLSDAEFAAELSEHGRQTILDHHTCAHRIDELFGVLARCSTQRVRRVVSAMETA